jgi:multifunctional 2-oxoglutarate metabolism enzyme
VAARLDVSFTEAQENEVKYEIQEITDFGERPIQKLCARTAAEVGQLEKVIEALTVLPEGFTLHPKLKTFLKRRRDAVDGGPVDWAFAEALAFGTLVQDGTPVRLSGQDSGRGTFSQRHLELYDYESGELYIPLRHISPDQARFDVYDSLLSEYAVMGFEFGYSIGDPLSLVLWEAQFGDFVNGAQIMIDQFITTAEQKWGQPSGLVLLLPHGYEGQGPEHSSARIERFMILCAEDNIQACNPTTAAQYFHLLRRQMYGGADRRGVRKPLVIFTPKSLLRHPKVACTLDDLTRGSFREVLGETESLSNDRVSRLLFCSGKVYYELLAAREEREAWNVAIVRIEQYYPFPKAEIEDQVLRYSPTCDVVWVQEEPRNMGAWRFLRKKMQPLLDPTKRTIRYIGRGESASPAPGSYKQHLRDQAEIIDACFAEQQVQSVRRVRAVQRRRK